MSHSRSTSTMESPFLEGAETWSSKPSARVRGDRPSSHPRLAMFMVTASATSWVATRLPMLAPKYAIARVLLWSGTYASSWSTASQPSMGIEIRSSSVSPTLVGTKTRIVTRVEVESMERTASSRKPWTPTASSNTLGTNPLVRTLAGSA